MHDGGDPGPIVAHGERFVRPEPVEGRAPAEWAPSHPNSVRPEPVEGRKLADLAARLAWLLRLRWLALPLLVALDLANDLLNRRPAPHLALVAGGALLALNAVDALLLRRSRDARLLVAWARIEAALVVIAPVLLVLLRADPGNPLRYAVLVGIVGAAVIPGVVDVAMIAAWGFAALVVADALAIGLDPARLDGAVVARWAVEGGLVAAVAAIAGFLQRAAAASSPARTAR
ncbi:MAG TPA: hypothetical protein VD838_20165, partial [Anaeromyxobacteraceae bacterium]|nr:hypothetical protein [Anaeromyxobacteraceae bacterium]